MKVYCEDCQNVIIEHSGIRYAKCRAYPKPSKKLHFVGRELTDEYRYCDQIRWRNGCRKYEPKTGDQL